MLFEKNNDLKIAALTVLAVLLMSAITLVTFRNKNKSPDITASNLVDTISETINIKTTLRDSIVHFAKNYLGKPYVPGACSGDGFDCSGFVYFVFKNFNITVPRSSSEFGNFGKSVPISEVKKGDVLVFKSPTRDAIGHVGIVTVPNGMQSEFIHASSGKEMKVILTNLSNTGYTNRFVKAVQVFK